MASLCTAGDTVARPSPPGGVRRRRWWLRARRRALEPAPSGPQRVTLNFDAVVNGAPFACGQSYTGIGLTGATMEPTDLRLYVRTFA
jgi:hypothetical protein